MSANETVHVSAAGGQKAGNDERYDLIPAASLRRLAIHAGTTVCAGGGSYHQMMRHAWAFWAGEDVDFMTDWAHLMAAAWEAFRIVQPDWRPPTWAEIDRRPGPERYDRIPPDALRQLAKHFGIGAKKYADDNWTRGYDWRLTFAAACRHAEQWRAGEEFDPETGSHHLIAFAWHMLVLDEFTRINRDGDTRYCTKVRRWLDAEQLYLWLDAEYDHHRRARNARRRKAFERVLAAGGDAPVAPGAPPGCRDRGPRCIGLCLACANDAAPAPRLPRVVTSLGDSERDAQWMGRCGMYRWNDRWERLPKAHSTEWMTTACLSSKFGPYTEVIVPRVVGALGDAERDAHEWKDRDGDRWAWKIASAHGYHTWHYRSRDPGSPWFSLGRDHVPLPYFGPFTEILAANPPASGNG